MSKKRRGSNCCKPTCCEIPSCGCPTARVCCSSMAVPTTAYQMVSTPQLVYDNVPASQFGMGSQYPMYQHGGGYPDGGFCGGSGFGGSWIIIIILLLCCCGGSGFGGCNDGCGDGCGSGFGGSWIIIIILLLCCCGGSGFGGGWC